MTQGALTVHPLTPDRWTDLERLFGLNGAYSNCWCAYQRVTGREFSAGCANRGTGNRALLRRLADDRSRPGLLAYRDGAPIGWVSMGPRTGFGRLLRSPILRLGAEDAADASVWSVACFFIPRAHRGAGVGTALLRSAIDAARAERASVLEAYPVDTAGRRVQASSIFTGTPELFERAGFTRVAERVAGRPVMRLQLR